MYVLCVGMFVCKNMAFFLKIFLSFTHFVSRVISLLHFLLLKCIV